MQFKFVIFLLYSCLFIGCTQSFQKRKVDENINNVVKETKEDSIIIKPKLGKAPKKTLNSSSGIVINDEFINIAYKGKDRSRIVKATDILAQVQKSVAFSSD